MAADWCGSRSRYRIPNTRLQIQFLISFKEQEVRCSFVQSAGAQPGRAYRRLETRYISYLNELPPAWLAFLPAIFFIILLSEIEMLVLGGYLCHGIKCICIFYDDSLGVSLSSDLTCDDDGELSMHHKKCQHF